MSRGALIHAYHLYKRRVSGLKKKCQIRTEWNTEIGRHWSRYALFAPRQQTRIDWKVQALMQVVILISYVGVICGSVWFSNSYSKDQAVYWGDISYFLASDKITWFYLKVPHVLPALYSASLFVTALFGKTPDLAWIELLETLKEESNPKMIPLKKAKRIKRVAAVICKTLSKVLPLLLAFFSFGYHVPYWMALNFWQLLVFGSFYSILYSIWIRIIGMSLAIQSTYYFLFCLYSSYALSGVVKDITTSSSSMFVVKLFSRKQIKNQVKNQLENINFICKMIRACNAYYTERLKFYFLASLPSLLVYIYPLSHGRPLLDVLVMLFVVVFCALSSAAFFISAAMVKSKIILCYKALNSLQLVPFLTVSSGKFC